MELIFCFLIEKKTASKKNIDKKGAGFLPAVIHSDSMLFTHPIQDNCMMFITTNTKHRQRVFEEDACARIAVETLYSIQDFYPFFLHGFVIMPDHVHLLLYIPSGGSLSKIIGIYKRAVTFNIGRGPLWQSRFHSLTVSHPQKFLQYIHLNPVKAGLSSYPEDYLWSSASGKWETVPFDIF